MPRSLSTMRATPSSHQRSPIRFGTLSIMNANERAALADTSPGPIRFRLDTPWVSVYEAVFPGDVLAPDDPRRPVIADEMRDVHRAITSSEAALVISWWDWPQGTQELQAATRELRRRLRRSRRIQAADARERTPTTSTVGAP